MYPSDFHMGYTCHQNAPLKTIKANKNSKNQKLRKQSTRLLSVYTGNCIEGSNPSLSARKSNKNSELEQDPTHCFFVRS